MRRKVFLLFTVLSTLLAVFVIFGPRPESQPNPTERRVDVTWTNSTATCATAGANGTVDACGAGSTAEIDVRGMGSAVIWMVPDITGTVSGGQICFDTSVNAADGSADTWEGLSGSNGDTTYSCSSLGGATFSNGKEAGWRFPVQNFDRLRVRLASAITCSNNAGAGPCSIRVSLRSGPIPATPFVIARQSDATRLHMTAHGSIANDAAEDPADFPLKIGGTSYQGNSEAIIPLNNLPNVSASAERATALMTPYNEQRTIVSDKLKTGTISTAVGSASAIGTTSTDVCTATACVVIPLEGMGSLNVTIPSQAWTGTLNFETSIDATNWEVVFGIETRIFSYASASQATCAGTCAGGWQFILQQGSRYFRVRASTMSNDVTLSISATAQTGIFGLAFIEGDIAHGGNDGFTRPVKIGGRATTSISGLTAVGDTTRVNATFDTSGRQITLPGCNIEDIVTGVDTDTDGSSTAVTNFSAIASVRYIVYGAIISNTSASMVTVDLRDGAAGSVKATLPAPATSGAVAMLPVPVPFTANTAVAVDASAGVTTLTTTLIGCKSR